MYFVLQVHYRIKRFGFFDLQQNVLSLFFKDLLKNNSARFIITNTNKTKLTQNFRKCFRLIHASQKVVEVKTHNKIASYSHKMHKDPMPDVQNQRFRAENTNTQYDLKVAEFKQWCDEMYSGAPLETRYTVKTNNLGHGWASNEMGIN